MRRAPISLALLALACTPPARPTPPSPPVTEAAPEAPTCPAPDLASWPVHLRDEPSVRALHAELSPDGKRLAVLDRKNKVRLLDAKDGHLLAEVETEEVTSWGNSPLLLEWQDANRLGLRRSRFEREHTMFIWSLGEPPSDEANAPLPAELSLYLVERHMLTRRVPPKGAPVPRRMVPVVVTPVEDEELLARWPLAMGVATASTTRISSFDPITLSPRGSFRGGTGSTILLSPDGETLLIQHDMLVTLVEVPSGKIIVESGKPLNRDPIFANRENYSIDEARQRVAFSLRTHGDQYELVVVDLALRKVLLRRAMSGDSGEGKATISPDGKRVCAPQKDSRCLIFDVETGKQMNTGWRGDFTSVAAPKLRLFDVTSEGCLTMLDPASGKPLWRQHIGGTQPGVRGVFASDDGQRAVLLSGGERRKLFALRPEGPKISSNPHGLLASGKLSGPDAHPTILEPDTAVIGPKGMLLSFSPSQPDLLRWDPTSLFPVENKKMKRNPLVARFSHDEKTLAFANVDGESFTWEIVSGQTHELAGGAAHELFFTDDDSHIVGVNLDGTLTAWATQTQTPVASWRLGLGARASASGGQTIVAHSPSTSQIVHLDIQTQQAARLPDCLPDRHALALAFSSRSVLLALGDTPGALCDLRTGALLARLAPGEASPTARVALDRRSDHLATVASASDNGSLVRVRDASTGRLLLTLPFPGVSAGNIEVAFVGGSLLVRHGAEATLFSLEGCESLDLRLVERGERLGWLASDRAGHWEGDQEGRASAWVRGPDGRDLPRAEGARWQQKGLLARFLTPRQGPAQLPSIAVSASTGEAPPSTATIPGR